MVKKVLPIVAITLLGLVLLGIKIYPELKGKWDEQQIANIQGKEQPNKKDSKMKDRPQKKTFPFNLKEEEEFAKKYPEQFAIVEKMYFSLDYIHNAYGEFEFQYSGDDPIKRVEFHVDFENQQNRVKIEELQDGKVMNTENVLVKDGVILRQKIEDKIFNEKPSTDNNISYINDIVTNSEWFVLIYNNYPDWQYKEGVHFNMPVYLIEGEISKSTSESLAGPFTMMISKETGALLDIKCYGQGDKPLLNVTVENITLNQGVKEEVFNLDVSGNKELSNLDYNMSDIENYQEKPGGEDTSND